MTAYVDAQPARKRLALIILVGPILVAEIAFAWNPDPVGQTLAMFSVVSALAHARLAYGWKSALAFFAISFGVSLTIENLGVTTGFPFGRYHFTVAEGLPHVGEIPLVVGILWFSMGYLAWQIASILLDDADLSIDSTVNLFALPVVAAFVMAQWDITMDRGGSTLGGAWVWRDGGGDFGVPLTNYFGWFLTSWLYFQVFAFYLSRQDAATRAPAASPTLRLVAVLFYLCAGLTHLVPWMMGASGEVADAGGRLWRVADARETTVAVMAATMLFSSVLAGAKLLQKRFKSRESLRGKRRANSNAFRDRRSPPAPAGRERRHKSRTRSSLRLSASAARRTPGSRRRRRRRRPAWSAFPRSHNGGRSGSIGVAFGSPTWTASLRLAIFAASRRLAVHQTSIIAGCSTKRLNSASNAAPTAPSTAR